MSLPVVAVSRKKKPKIFLMDKSGKRFSKPLNPTEKAQVKNIATKLDNKGKQVCEANSMSPAVPDTGAAYVNYQYPGIPQALGDLMLLLPKITQGENRSQRLGSKINLTSISCKFFFHIPPAIDQTNDNSSIHCRLLVLSPKIINKLTTLQANWTVGEALRRRYLRDGEDATSFQGDLNSLRFPVNTALFTTHHDRFFTLNRGTTTGDAGLTHIPDVQKVMNLNIKVKSKYARYAEPGDLYPENFAPFAILLYAPCNGGVTSGSSGIVYGNAFVRTNWKNLM